MTRRWLIFNISLMICGRSIAAESHPPLSELEVFGRHFAPYEPMYFIAGTDSPNAKFQLSFRYQVVTGDGGLARRWPGMTNLNVAYTQLSLWDWNAPSAPFRDTAYQPALIWLKKDIQWGSSWSESCQFDLEGGLQHQSNGRSGADSRSLNIAFLRPTLTWKHDDWFVRLAPKAFLYVGNLHDNPDLPDYRGHLDLQVTVGQSNGLQISGMGRIGDGLRRGSIMVDVTWPLSRVMSRSLAGYLHVQYFTGYGESLIDYRERSQMIRAGFALFR